MTKMQISIYDESLNLIGIIDDYESASYTRSFFESGKWTVEINRNIPNSTLFQKNRIVQFGDDPRDSGKITTVKQKIDENGKGSEKLTVTGYDLRYFFAQRLIMELNDVDAYYHSAPGETIIKTLVSSQCGATCTNPKRVFPLLTIATDQGRGSNYTLSTKYTQVYKNCATVATQTGIGWFVTIDHVNKVYILDCEVGLDRSVDQTVNPFCIFSPEMDSLKSATFVDDVGSYRNHVYVGGDGLGEARVIQEEYITTEKEGFERFEMWKDASSVSTTTALTAEGQAALAQYAQTYELDGEVLVKSPFIYKEQYNVGDLCTVRFLDVDLNVRVLEIQESWQYGEYSISSVWGKPLKTLASQVADVANTTTTSATTGESGTNVSGMKAGIKAYDLSSASATMTGAECLYNIIELTGTMTGDRTFTFYLDPVRFYGKKHYKLLISAVGDTVKRFITLTAGGTRTVELWIDTTHVPDTHDVIIDSAGNVDVAHWDHELPLKATQFPGICATTPIPASAISINYTTRILTITPPLGYFYFFVDGNGVVTRFKKVGNVSFPAFTDTDGIWYFYFDATGTAVTTQTPWTTFDVVATVYRLLWNTALTGSAKSAVENIETHPNSVPGIDHTWKHAYGSVWAFGAVCVNSKISTGTPATDGSNTVVSLTTGNFLDDNLAYTITNSTGGGIFQQDLGVISAPNATNAGLFKIRYQTASNRTTTLPATRFPFAWDSGTNIPQYITTAGVRTPVSNQYYFCYYLYVIQDPRTGEAIRIISDAAEYSTIDLAQASSWATIQGLYTTINDTEIRPLYKLIFQYKNIYDVGAKYTALRQVDDLRKATVAQVGQLSGTLPATSVTVTPVGNITATTVQSAIQQLDEKAHNIDGGSVSSVYGADQVINGGTANG